MIAAVRNGKKNTAMQPFATILSAEEIDLVVDFIRREFISSKNKNTQYHTAENGWPNHQRYREVFPFVRGEIAIDTDDVSLSLAQRNARKIFSDSCISCHEPVYKKKQAIDFEPYPISFPRNGVTPQNLDAVSAATPYSKHDRASAPVNLDQRQRQGKLLFEKNCSFCHGIDGSGKNWIGQFIEPHPRDLTDRVLSKLSQRELKNKIANGVVGTAMPAWKTVLSEDELDTVALYVRTVLAAR